MLWLVIWIAVTVAGFWLGGVGAGVVLSLVVGLFALLRSGGLKWQ